MWDTGGATQEQGGQVLIIYAGGPLWVRVLIAFGATVLFLVLAWKYYTHFWRRDR